MAENHNRTHHVIDITSGDASSSISHHYRPSSLDTLQHEKRSSRSTRWVSSQSNVLSPNTVKARNPSSGKTADARRHWMPLISGRWIAIILVLTMTQIVASIVVPSVSRNDRPQAPLLVWIVGYASGCGATMPLHYWLYSNCDQDSEQDSAQTRPNSTRLKTLMEQCKSGLDCFFVAWLVLGIVWIFKSSADEAPNMYRLCIVFLAFYGTGCGWPKKGTGCGLPLILPFVSALGVRDVNMSTIRAAQEEAAITAMRDLPRYRFKLKKIRNGVIENTQMLVMEQIYRGVISGKDDVGTVRLLS